MTKRRLILSTGIGLAIGATGVATGAIPTSTTGIIAACYDTSGTVKVIDREAGAACPAGSTSLNWNAQGRTGPTGMRGPKGDPGPARAYWAKFSASKLTAASERPAGHYAYGQYGYNYVSFTGVDVSKCSVNVTIAATDYKYRSLAGNYLNYGNTWVLAYAADASGNFVPNVPMDVLVNCSDTTFVP